ncbi:MAG: hypothetical protein KFF73_00610 [Cyclobacteriaceae bacterium]|nr:hypothetical protein [Cyclobacteriaceae bacterium]
MLGSTLGYILTNAVLSMIYTYHVEVGALILVLSSLIIMAIGLATTTSTIYKTATANPATTLRNE